MEILTPEQEEQQRRLQQEAQERATIARPATPPIAGATSAAPTGPPVAISRPSGEPRAIKVPSTYNQDANAAQADKERMISQGSGIHQIRNPILRTLARIGDIAGTAMFPGVTGQIPGTELHHRGLIAQRTGQVNQDLAAAGKEAQTEQQQALAEQEQAKAADLANPQPKPKEEKWKIVPEFTGPNGEPMEVEENSGQIRIGGENVPGIKRYDKEAKKPAHVTYDSGIPVSVVSPTGDVFDVNDPKLPEELKPLVQAAQRAHGQRTQEQIDAEDRHRNSRPETGTWQLQRDEAGNAVMFNSKTGEVKNAPAGLVPKGEKPSADEQRRADLAVNMNENLSQLEEILARRPELFGPFAGRMTGIKGALGTDDPDVAALSAIKEQMGMAMVGAHAMRNAQHVETAANAIVNGFKNNPNAVKAAIQVARNSLQTFINDAQKGKAPQTAKAGAVNAGSASSARYTEGGQTYTIPAEHEQEFVKDHPKAKKL